MAADSTLLGILVGGRGRRLGGVDKARLPAPDTGEPLYGRLLRLAREVGAEPVLLGRTAGEVDGVRRLADAPAGVGPLGGLGALVHEAAGRPAALLACDLPYVERPLLRRLLREAPSAAVLAPRIGPGGKWEVMFARYDSNALRGPLSAAVAAGEHSLQRLLRDVDVCELELSTSERRQLRDWDTPEDLLG